MCSFSLTAHAISSGGEFCGWGGGCGCDGRVGVMGGWSKPCRIGVEEMGSFVAGAEDVVVVVGMEEIESKESFMLVAT